MKKTQTYAPMRIPTDDEWDRLVEITGGNTYIIHWRWMASWVYAHEIKTNRQEDRANRGYSSALCWDYDLASCREVAVGFRPTIDIPGADTLLSGLKDGDTAIIGTLYMNGQPIKVPEYPNAFGDIQKYAPGATLEMHPALDDPDYQVVGIRVDNAIIADRNILSMISYEDIEAGVTLR